MKPTFLLASAIVASTVAAPALAIPNTHKEVLESAEVFLELVEKPEARVPASLIRQSSAIAIITNVKEGGFILGGRRGDGVMVSRLADGSWSNPAFVNLSGGSVGFQAGFQSSDILLLFPSQAALNQVLSGDFELGGSVSGTAGPIGKSAEESLEGFDGDRVLVYSQSDGLFGGVTLEGSELDFDQEDNQKFYGQPVTSKEILSENSLRSPAVVYSLKSILAQAE